jgi:hypothetical protein
MKATILKLYGISIIFLLLYFGLGSLVYPSFYGCKPSRYFDMTVFLQLSLFEFFLSFSGMYLSSVFLIYLLRFAGKQFKFSNKLPVFVLFLTTFLNILFLIVQNQIDCQQEIPSEIIETLHFLPQRIYGSLKLLLILYIPLIILNIIHLFILSKKKNDKTNF